MATQLVGEWGRVTTSDGDGVGVALDRFSTELTYANVAYVLQGTDDPEKGSLAFLHFDSTGQPAYAVVWT